MTTSKTYDEYVVIRTTNYYGPSTKHTLVEGEDFKPLIFEEKDAAEQATTNSFGTMELGDKEASFAVDIWGVVCEVDPNDACGWPPEMQTGLVEVLKDHDIDPEDAEAIAASEVDLPSEAAEMVGHCLVWDETADRWLLCRPLD